MSSKKLKILFVLQTPWGAGLGMSKVHYELKQAYEKLGHTVDWLDHNKIYPKRESIFAKAFGKSTQYRILDFLKKNAYKYDVIDANQRCIPFPKESFGFKGLLVFRSHGIPPIYRLEELNPLYLKMTTPAYNHKNTSFKNRLGNLKRYLLQNEGEWAFWDSVRYADVVHVLNMAEYKYLKEYGIKESKLVLVPNGLSDSYIKNGELSLSNTALRTEVSVVGSWTIRKGITHLPGIAEQIDANCSKINILGTGNNSENILSHFSELARKKINLVIHFPIETLATLLYHTKVGIFPSYIEGMPLAIIEQIALGIPVVAFDIPGAKFILEKIDASLLVPVGDEEAIVAKVNDILNMSATDYLILCKKCYERASEFKNSIIAEQFLNIYHLKSEEINAAK